MRISTRGLLVTASLAVLAAAAPASAQTAKTARKSLAGQWTGTVTVPLRDSSIVAPVVYNFADSAGTVVGTAMVPGQGMGPISHVVRDGEKVRFRVTVKQAEKTRLLEHEAVLGADGAIEGMVNLDAKPVAKFRIAPKK